MLGAIGRRVYSFFVSTPSPAAHRCYGFYSFFSALAPRDRGKQHAQCTLAHIP